MLLVVAAQDQDQESENEESGMSDSCHGFMVV